MRNGQNASYQQFSHNFLKTGFVRSWEYVIKILLVLVTKGTAIVSHQTKIRQHKIYSLILEICFWKGRKHCGKRRKYLLLAFSPFPTMFSKGFFLKVVKSRDFCDKDLIKTLPNDKILDVTKLKAFADDKLTVAKMMISLF